MRSSIAVLCLLLVPKMTNAQNSPASDSGAATQAGAKPTPTRTTTIPVHLPVAGSDAFIRVVQAFGSAGVSVATATTNLVVSQPMSIANSFLDGVGGIKWTYTFQALIVPDSTGSIVLLSGIVINNDSQFSNRPLAMEDQDTNKGGVKRLRQIETALRAGSR